MTLYTITQALIDALDNLEVDEDGCILNMDELDKLQMDFDDKAVNVALAIKNLKSEAEAIKAEKMALAKRQKSAETNAENLKTYLDNMLKAVGKTELKDSKVALSYRKVPDVVELNLNEVSHDWLKVKTTFKEDDFDKTRIKNALKNGEKIPGAILVDKMNLQIK